jgi:peptidyl-prolyl cis-trans isomerase B (cyclophilin B)
LNALARLAPAEAATRIQKPALLKSQQWQVRAAVATIAGAAKNEALLEQLSKDATPNVRTSVLAALDSMKSARLYPTAIAALESTEPQLVREAARRLKGAPKTSETASALLAALGRLTIQGKDTSRDPRLAIFERLDEQATAANVDALKPYLTDFDPEITKAAKKQLERLVPGVEFRAEPKVRAEWASNIKGPLPRTATLIMAGGGRLELQLFVDDAPKSVARFVELARSGYYDGLTFHRIVPNFVIQGGSPDANEYSGDDRFMRDELGRAPHLRGSVGISTRGRDTGDAQIFFDLLDLPRLDHDYTVFAMVNIGLDVMDRILEGAIIMKIIV